MLRVFAGLVESIVLFFRVAFTSGGILDRPQARPVWCLLLDRLMGVHGFSYDVSKGCGVWLLSRHERPGWTTSTTAMRPF